MLDIHGIIILTVNHHCQSTVNPLHGLHSRASFIHSSTTSCLECVCGNKSVIIGTLASVLVLTGQTCGDCYLFQIISNTVLLGFNTPYFIVKATHFLLSVKHPQRFTRIAFPRRMFHYHAQNRAIKMTFGTRALLLYSC